MSHRHPKTILHISSAASVSRKHRAKHDRHGWDWPIHCHTLRCKNHGRPSGNDRVGRRCSTCVDGRLRLVGTRRCNAQSRGQLFLPARIVRSCALGKVMSFLLIWQTMFQAPLVIASGAIGFAQYFTYLVPLTSLGQKAISGALVIILVVLLYRRITQSAGCRSYCGQAWCLRSFG